MNKLGLVLLCLVLGADVFAKTEVSGELKKWHKVTLTFDGPEVSETDKYNPFMNYRLNVTFTHPKSGKRYVVPGYFAADGNAGETSAIKGNKWRVHFAPDELGAWTWAVDFRRGKWTAVSQKKNTGESGKFMDGEKGRFEIAPTDKTGNDFRRRGRLQYVGEHYLKFAETGECFLKIGPDAPENFLSYKDFDGTFHNDGKKDNLVKTWSAHVKDWKPSNPTWKNGKGKAMIGALNYLASKGLNSVSFLTMNVGGDDHNVFPYTDYHTWNRFDCSKLDQWETVFSHAQQLGLFLHFKMMEVENQGLLDNGAVGANTKIYYRELIARFGHHLALNWNVCEESGEWERPDAIRTPPQDTPERLACAQRLYEQDPYGHHRVIHNGKQFDDLLGPESKYTGPSLQTHKKDFSMVPGQVLKWRRRSAEAGKPWAVSVDEPGDASFALAPDVKDPDGINHFNARKNALWGAFLSGAWGVEWYFGYKYPHSDLSCQDYRSRDRFWDYCRHLLTFFDENNIPVQEMEPLPKLVPNGFCLAKPDELYVIYIPKGGSANLDLPDGEYNVGWFNPRAGDPLKEAAAIKGGQDVHIGSAPADLDKDWVALISAK